MNQPAGHSESPVPAIVPVDWLRERLGDPQLRILDASWYLPGMQRDADAEYRISHIPGAVRGDPDILADPGSTLPHMLPDAERFARIAGEQLGIGENTHVIVYDGSGVNLSAPRVWWTFRVFGHERVSVLDGGLGAWRAAGMPLEQGEVQVEPRRSPLRAARTDLVRSLDDMRELAGESRTSAELVDARSRARFEGTAPEPRPGLRSGHIPGSRNLPFTGLVDPDTGLLLSRPALLELFRAAGVRLDRPVVTTCGSGMSACAIALALHVLGRADVAVYDGSWAEWGARDDVAVATGEAD